MESMFPAEPTILLCFHSVRMVSFLFGRVVVALFALCTLQSDLCTHLVTSVLFLSIKKRPETLVADKYSIGLSLSQAVF